MTDRVPEQQQVAESMATELPRGPRALLRRTWADFSALRATKYGVLPLAIIVLVDLLQGLDDRVGTLLLPEIRRDLGVTLTQLAVINQLFLGLGLLAMPLIGHLTDHVRRRRVLVGASATLSGAFSVAASFAGTATTYAGLNATDVASERLGDAPATALLTDYYPIEARAKVISLRRCMQLLAAPVTTVGFGWLAATFGWRVALRVVAGPLALAGILAVILLREPVRGYWERLRAGEDEATALTAQPPMRFTEAIRTLLRIKSYRRMMFVFPLLTVAQSGFNSLFVFFLADELHLSPLQRTLVGLPEGLLGVAALLFGAVAADAMIKRKPGKVMVLNAAVGVLIAALQIPVVLFPSVWLVVMFVVVRGVLDRFLEPAVYASGSLIVPPRMRGQAFAIFGLLVLPALPFAVLPAYLADRIGVRMAMLVFSPLYVVASLVLVTAARYFDVDHRAAVASANATNEYNRAKAEGRIKLLVCRDVDVEYNGVQVLFGVDLDVEEGELVALLGTNGAGKSTLLRAISGTQEASNGAILFDGRNITHLPPHEIARLGIVHMPGGRSVFPSLTVAENLDLAALALDDAGEELRARRERVFELFPVLRERLHQPAGALSGGEQQMVGLAQAFLWQPKLLLIDELSLGLAPAVVGTLLDVVREINASGTAVVLVEQSVNVSLTVAHRAVFMEKGEVRFDGPTADLLHAPDVMRAVYLKGASGVTVAPRAPRPDADTARVLLDVRDLRLSFGGVRALDGVSFQVREGESLGLIGPNGAGKTTVFDVVSGYLQPDSGAVLLDGVDVTRMPPEARARLGLVRRFQDAALFGSLTVFEAVCLALEKQHEVRNVFVSALPIGPVRRSEARVRARADQLVELLELGDFRDKLVSELSTGLRRVTDLACVLAAQPRLLLLDEPSSGIAQAEAENLAPLLNRVRADTGCAVLVIEHDMPLIRRVSDELLALVQGRPVVRGPASDVLDHPDVVAAYLGDDRAAFFRSGVPVP